MAKDDFLDSLDEIENDGDDKSLVKGDYTELRQKLEYRLTELKTDRSEWLKTWRDCATFINPASGKYISSPQTNPKGEAKKEKILSNIATSALRTFSAGMLGGMSSPVKPWFQLTTPSSMRDDQSVKQWLSDVEELMRAVMHKSNYYGSLAQAYFDMGLYGTHAMIIYEDDEKTIRCESLPIGSYMLGMDDKGNITTLIREFNLTLYQMVERFGDDNLSRSAEMAWERKQGLETQYTLIQAIFPNKDYEESSPSIKKRAYLDCTWETGGEAGKMLQVKGFKEKPFFAPRWSVLNGDVYGESPAMEALPDIKRLQYYTEKEMSAVGKVVSPPLLASSSLENEPTHLIPDGITYAANIQEHGMRELYSVNPAIVGLIQTQNSMIERRINDAFRTDLWMMLANLEGVQPRTQMELMERKGEKILQLSPNIQKVQSELLNPSIDRLFNIMLRNELLPPVPDSLKRLGGDLKIEYTSELAVAQNAKDTVPIEQLVAFVGNLAGAKPEALAKIDANAVIDDYAERLGTSPKLVLSTEQANAIIQQQQQQQQQQMMMQQGLQMAQAGKLMSDTNVGGGLNALQMAGIGG